VHALFRPPRAFRVRSTSSRHHALIAAALGRAKVVTADHVQARSGGVVMATCGVWMTVQRLVAVGVDDDGSVLAADRCRRCDDARWDMVSRLESHLGLDCRLVVRRRCSRPTCSPHGCPPWRSRPCRPDMLIPAGTRLAGLARASRARSPSCLRACPSRHPSPTGSSASSYSSRYSDRRFSHSLACPGSLARRVIPRNRPALLFNSDTKLLVRNVETTRRLRLSFISPAASAFPLLWRVGGHIDGSGLLDVHSVLQPAHIAGPFRGLFSECFSPFVTS